MADPRAGHPARAKARHARVLANLGITVDNQRSGHTFQAVRTPHSERLPIVELEAGFNVADRDPWTLEHVDPATDIKVGDLLTIPAGSDARRNCFRAENVAMNYEGPANLVTHITVLVYAAQDTS